MSALSKAKEKDKDKDKDKLIEVKRPPLPYNFNISDIIAKNIFEKILSLAITQSEQNTINNKIPSFCFEEIKQSLELAIYVDFLNYDKDDMKPKRNILNIKSKSQTNLKFKYETYNKIFHNKNNLDKSMQKKIIIKNKSELLKLYKFHKKLDPNLSDEYSINLDVFKSQKKKKGKNEKNKKKKDDKKEKEKEKKIDINKLLLRGLILRDHNNNDNINKIKNDEQKSEEKFQNENEEPFVINSPELIENIQNIESHKLDENIKFYAIFKNNYTREDNKLTFDIIKKGKNHWGIIGQPIASQIDRDAGTKIKYEKPILKTKKTKEIIIKEIEEKDISKKEDINAKSNKNINNNKNAKKKKAFVYNYNKENETNTRKKKFMPIIEFPSEDLDPKIFSSESDNAELQKLRDNLEREIAEKKMEIANKIKKEKEEQALEKELEERRKELANKNVTVDVKGELVYIKSLDVNQFMNDFTNTKYGFKQVKTIESESKSQRAKRRKSTIVEKNPEINFEIQDSDKSQKKKHKVKFPNIGRKSNSTEDKNIKNQGINHIFILDKNKEPIMGSGSNFDIMNPVCGVNLTEDKKMKSGGKDFFHKYNKYSIQIFEETLNRTISSNFYQNMRNNIFHSTTSPNVMSLRKKTVREIMNKTNKEKTQENNEDISKNINLTIPTETNNKLIVKAKNLKMALNDLDLISEGEEKYLSVTNKYKNKNIIKRKQFMDLDKEDIRNYNEIDKFAKTLVGSQNWGDNIYSKSKVKRSFRMPKKPIIDILKREVPNNLLNRLPRKRLPPINRQKENNDFGKTISEGFFNKKRRKKLNPLSPEENKNVKIEPPDDGTIEEKKNDHNFSANSKV